MDSIIRIFVGVCITLFIVSFFLKNIRTSKNIGGTVKGKSWKVNVLTILITILYLLTYISISTGTRFLYGIDLLNPFYFKLIGIILITIALVLGISTLITMKNSWRMGITEGQNTDLIVNGIFRYSRNPYFLSYYLIFLGVFLVFPTLVYLAFYIPALFLTHLMVLDEEKFLTKLHGNLYVEYKRKVKRYIPI